MSNIVPIKVLTKTKLLGGFQCHRLIYLQVHRPKWARANTAGEKFVFEQGHIVGAEARKRFPGGRLIDVPPWEYEEAAKRTKENLNQTLFEAAFINGPLFVRTDILEKTENGWNLIEVKSSTSVKEENLFDCTIQYVVLKGLGMAIEKVKLMHINKNCVAPLLDDLFTVEDITEEVRSKSQDLKKSISDFIAMVREPRPPEIKPGLQCGLPYDCRFKEKCWSELLVPSLSVLNLPDIRDAKKWDLFHAGKSIESLDQKEFSEITRRALKAHRTGQPTIEKQELHEKLSQWQRPFWFLDFETSGTAIPKFSGTRPYEQVPFQYSLHVQSEPKGGIRQEEFLDTSGEDPREKLILKLLKDIGPEGNIIAYYDKFEKKVIEDLAREFPKYSKALRELLPRFRDPLQLIRETIYFTEFEGSFSLKKVGPALVGKDFSYSDMRIQDGSMAQAAYLECVRNPSEELRGALREYCGRDTLILVKLVDRLLDLSS